MRDAAGQGAQRLEFLRLAKLLLQSVALGDIHRHAYQADDVAGLVSQRRQDVLVLLFAVHVGVVHHLSPKNPAQIPELPLCGRRVEQLLVDLGQRVADDLALLHHVGQSGRDRPGMIRHSQIAIRAEDGHGRLLREVGQPHL